MDFIADIEQIEQHKQSIDYYQQWLTRLQNGEKHILLFGRSTPEEQTEYAQNQIARHQECIAQITNHQNQQSHE